MTEDQRKKMLADFRHPVQDDEITDDWTEEEIIESAKRIIKKLNLEGEIANENDLQ
jgi:hypothetical protein